MRYPTIECKKCGTPFEPERKNQIFCTTPCREAWWSWHWKHEKHKCTMCGALHSPPVPEEIMADILETPYINASES